MILIGVVFANPPASASGNSKRVPQQEAQAPLSTILKADGSLDLNKGFSGSLSTKGYKMITAADGSPRFVSAGDSAGTAPVPASSSPSENSDLYWDDQFSFAGTDGDVYAVAVDAAGNIYIGGSFNVAGNVMAHSVAKWNGSTWSALGTGMSGAYHNPIAPAPVVHALAISGNDVYAGGDFSSAGGVTANGIARWDGTSWSAVGGGMNEVVRALAASGGNVYAGGRFSSIGGTAANGIAVWNGSSWSALGNGIRNRSGSAGYVMDIATNGTNVFAAGDFNHAGDINANCIAKWNGSNWSALGTGVSGSVDSLAIDGNDLYVGGSFYAAGGVAANSIAKWDDAATTWSALGSGVFGLGISSIVLSGGSLYAGGDFSSAGGQSANNIARWNGSSWSPVGPGTNESVRALAVNGNEICAGGKFEKSGNVAMRSIGIWNGSAWSALGADRTLRGWSSAWAIAVEGDNVYAGGWFTSADGITANQLAKWDGTSWTTLGTGVGGCDYALAVSGGTVYAGGDFVEAGGVSANRVAKWDGTSWSPLGSGIGDSTSTVYALAAVGSDLYVGGQFTSAGGISAQNIAKWDGTSWSALGAGFSHDTDAVYAIAKIGNYLYVGGDFVMTNGSPTYYIARWDGTVWSPLSDAIVNGPVRALAVSGNDLYAGGSFSKAGELSVNQIAKWDGSSWSALGAGMGGIQGRIVYSVAISGNQIYAGGLFQSSGGTTTNNVAKWNGANWETLGSGVYISTEHLYSQVNAVALSGEALFAGGNFSMAGNKGSGYFGCYQPRVNVSRDSVTANPGSRTLGANVYGFYKPALITGAGTTISFSASLPTTVTLAGAAEIWVKGQRVNSAFTLSPGGMTFGGEGATLRVEFSEDDAAAFGTDYTEFRVASLTYPPDYPASKTAAQVKLLSSTIPVPSRIENGRQIYSMTAPITAIGSTYGAVPQSFTKAKNWQYY